MLPDLKGLDIDALQKLGEQVLQEIVKRAKSASKKVDEETRSSSAQNNSLRPPPSKVDVTEIIHKRETQLEGLLDKDIDGCQYVGNDISAELIGRNIRTLSLGAVRYIKVSKIFFQADLMAMDANMMELVNNSCVTGEVIQRNTDSIVLKVLGLPVKLRLNFTRVKESIRAMEHNVADCNVWFTETLLRNMAASTLMADRLKYNTLICLLTESPTFLSDDDWHRIDRVKQFNYESNSLSVSYRDIEALPLNEVQELGLLTHISGHSSSSSLAVEASRTPTRATVTPDPPPSKAKHGINVPRINGRYAPFDHKLIADSLNRGPTTAGTGAGGTSGSVSNKNETPDSSDAKETPKQSAAKKSLNKKSHKPASIMADAHKSVNRPARDKRTAVSVPDVIKKESTSSKSSLRAALKNTAVSGVRSSRVVKSEKSAAEGYSTRSGRNYPAKEIKPATATITTNSSSSKTFSGGSSSTGSSGGGGGGRSVKAKQSSSTIAAGYGRIAAAIHRGKEKQHHHHHQHHVGPARFGSYSWMEWENEDIYGKKYQRRDRSVSVMDRLTRIEFPSKNRKRRLSDNDDSNNSSESESEEDNDDDGASRDSDEDKDQDEPSSDSDEHDDTVASKHQRSSIQDHKRQRSERVRVHVEVDDEEEEGDDVSKNGNTVDDGDSLVSEV